MFVLQYQWFCGRWSSKPSPCVLIPFQTSPHINNNHGWSTYPHVRYPHEKQSLNNALLREQLWLITCYQGLICHGGTFHGGMLTSHEKNLFLSKIQQEKERPLPLLRFTCTGQTIVGNFIGNNVQALRATQLKNGGLADYFSFWKGLCSCVMSVSGLVATAMFTEIDMLRKKTAQKIQRWNSETLLATMMMLLTSSTNIPKQPSKTTKPTQRWLDDSWRCMVSKRAKATCHWSPLASKELPESPSTIELVVSTHLKNISQIGSFPQGSGWTFNKKNETTT